MLKIFKVRNFKNFEEEFVLDLSKVNNYTFNECAIKNGILKNVLVYGDNGSGKTNLGYALFDIILHLTDKEKTLTNYRLYGNLNQNEGTFFSYTFSFDEGTLLYEYEKTEPQKIVYERIYINDELKLDYNYNTHIGRVMLRGAETLNTDLTEKNISFVKYVYSNTVLDESVQENILFKKFFAYVNNMLWFSSLEKNDYQGYANGNEGIAQGIIKREKEKDFELFLKSVGIEYSFNVVEVEGEKKLYCKFTNRNVDFFSIASRGTCSLALFYYWLIRLEKVSLVFIDEFDAFYHNNLAESIVKELMKLPNTQSILTTHNTDIMSNDLLRPDCYLQIVNGRIKSFSESTNKELRKAHNLQKMYNAGAFDGTKENSNHL